MGTVEIDLIININKTEDFKKGIDLEETLMTTGIIEGLQEGLMEIEMGIGKREDDLILEKIEK